MALRFEHASRILTLAGSTEARAGTAMRELATIEDGTLIVERASIRWVGPAAAAPSAAPGDEIVDVRGKTLMPALVDAHTHVVWGGDRRDELEMRLQGADYEAIFEAGGGILSSVRQTQALDDDELYTQTLRRVRRMQRCGTTTFEIKSGYGLDLETELKQLRVARRLSTDAGVRVKTTCLAAHAVPERARGSQAARDAFVDEVCETILPAVAESGLADACDVFCDRGAFTADESRRILARAKGLGFPLRVHANEFGHTGGALVAAELGAQSADHLLHLDDNERAALRDAGTVAVLLPGTSTVLGKPFADGRALVQSQVPIAVATDCNPGSCAFENLATVLALACYGCRLTPAEAIVGATHNAAASLGLSSEVGRLEAGLAADLIVLDTDDPRDLVYHASSPLISAVYSSGSLVP